MWIRDYNLLDILWIVFGVAGICEICLCIYGMYLSLKGLLRVSSERYREAIMENADCEICEKERKEDDKNGKIQVIAMHLLLFLFINFLACCILGYCL